MNPPDNKKRHVVSFQYDGCTVFVESDTFNEDAEHYVIRIEGDVWDLLPENLLGEFIDKSSRLWEDRLCGI